MDWWTMCMLRSVPRVTRPHNIKHHSPPPPPQWAAQNASFHLSNTDINTKQSYIQALSHSTSFLTARIWNLSKSLKLLKNNILATAIQCGTWCKHRVRGSDTLNSISLAQANMSWISYMTPGHGRLPSPTDTGTHLQLSELGHYSSDGSTLHKTLCGSS